MNRMRIALAVSLAGAVSIGLRASADPPTTYLPAAEVTAAFAKGRPLLEVDGYKIHASRRESAGQAEVHARDTDVIYVLEGGATIVTGGSVVEPHSVADDEVRGRLIDGGATRELTKGDVFVIPNGVPHWFKTVQAPLLYYVVKVTAPSGGTR
jgi:mannose-6-phosphate isomerase-like protein (cupin superfamily)